MYVDAYWDKEKDVVKVVERVNGERIFKEFPAVYEFFYEDQNGSYQSTGRTPIKRVECKTNKAFRKERKMFEGRRIYESDQNVLFKTLKANYPDKKVPNLNISFFDIEVDFVLGKGFAPTDDTFAPITAISVYNKWEKKLYTLVIKPPEMAQAEAERIVAKFDDTILCTDEKQLLRMFYAIIEDADVISGWNSDGYDVPYVVNRTIWILDKEATKGFCLWNKAPKKKIRKNDFGAEMLTFQITGKVHIDYLDLYKKHTPITRPSYKLDSIGEIEVGERKVQYEGTLYSLYRDHFEKFIEYNRQDTLLIDKIDEKKQFIVVANNVAHQTFVLMESTMGTVSWVDQAIINEANDLGFRVPDKIEDEGESRAAGAWVAEPVLGLHKYVGAVDINSLYPSNIRALNMSPETIIAQVRNDLTNQYLEDRVQKEKLFKSQDGVRLPDYAAAWKDQFCSKEYEAVMRKDNTELTVDFEDGTSEVMTAAELYDLIFDDDSNLCISANATIFRTDIDGIIPALLTRWYSDRQEMQAKMRKAAEEGDTEQATFWKMNQQIVKIYLNSLYGALLNKSSKFYDKRLGQSVTLTGRMINRHQTAAINEQATGVYDHEGEVIIAGDTDSAYWSCYDYFKKNNIDFEFTHDNVVDLYDAMAEEVNASFPGKMDELFHTGYKRGSIIQAGRELVGSSALWVAKKKYGIMIYDDEGTRVDVDNKPGKLKVMGLDIKRSDTPGFMQDFLEECLYLVLSDGGEKELQKKIQDFRAGFRDKESWLKGSPKAVNKLGYYANELKENPKARLPGHVRATINWNNLVKMHNDLESDEIEDGGRIIVCQLKKNPMNITSIAYPMDQLNLPDWFKSLPFDDAAMENKVMEKKLNNMFEPLNWDLHLGEQGHAEALGSLFTF